MGALGEGLVCLAEAVGEDQSVVEVEDLAAEADRVTLSAHLVTEEVREVWDPQVSAAGEQGMGGAIFVSKGATLNLVGSISLANTSTATGGAAGGAGATDGNALGQQIFLMSSGTINFARCL